MPSFSTSVGRLSGTGCKSRMDSKEGLIDWDYGKPGQTISIPNRGNPLPSKRATLNNMLEKPFQSFTPCYLHWKQIGPAMRVSIYQPEIFAEFRLVQPPHGTASISNPLRAKHCLFRFRQPPQCQVQRFLQQHQRPVTTKICSNFRLLGLQLVGEINGRPK